MKHLKFIFCFSLLLGVFFGAKAQPSTASRKDTSFSIQPKAVFDQTANAVVINSVQTDIVTNETTISVRFVNQSTVNGNVLRKTVYPSAFKLKTSDEFPSGITWPLVKTKIASKYSVTFQ